MMWTDTAPMCHLVQTPGVGRCLGLSRQDVANMTESSRVNKGQGFYQKKSTLGMGLQRGRQSSLQSVKAHSTSFFLSSMALHSAERMWRILSLVLLLQVTCCSKAIEDAVVHVCCRHCFHQQSFVRLERVSTFRCITISAIALYVGLNIQRRI